MKGDKLGRQSGSGRRQGGSGSQEQPQKGDKLGRHSGCQEQPRKEIMKLGRQGGSGSQEQPREVMKGDKVRRQGDSGSQEQPRKEILKGD